MLLLVIRTIILYFITMLSMRAMGKRQIGQLQPFELVVILIISEMATIGVESNGTSIFNSILPIVTITVLQMTIALLNLKSQTLRTIICGKPIIIISNGEIMEEKMRELRLNTNDLLEQLRAQGYFNVAEVEFAIMETNGQVSIMPRADKRPVQPSDIDLEVPNDEPALTLILDGVIHNEHLAEKGHDEVWLSEKLKSYNIFSHKDVFFLSVDGEGNIFCQLKAKDETGSPKPIREGAKTAPKGSGKGTKPEDVKE